MILNRQRRVRVSVRALEKFLARARRRLRVAPDALTICLVTNVVIGRWNRAYRGKSGPTDVLSFPADEADPHQRGRNGNRGGSKRGFSFTSFASSSSPARYLGDIAIAPAVARRNARRYGRSLDEEMRILILHGILHLMGYDHETDRGEMNRREQRLRRELRLE